MTGRQVWTQDSAGVPGTARPDDGFGATLAVGRLNGDAIPDLAIAAPEDNNGTGSVTVLLGSPAGLTTAGYGGTTFTQSTPGIGGASAGTTSASLWRRRTCSGPVRRA